MAHNRQMRSSSANFVTQLELKENMLNLEKTMKEDNMLVVEGLVTLQCKVNTINSQVKKRLSNIEGKIKHCAERTSSLYLQFRRDGRVVSKEKDAGQNIQNSANHAQVTSTRKRGGNKSSTRKFKCNICGKDYSSKGGHKIHQLVHSDPQNWNRCTLCDYKTPYKFNLSRHMGTVHKNK